MKKLIFTFSCFLFLLSLRAQVLYGITGVETYSGTIFSIDVKTKTYTKLKQFSGANGEDPNGSLIQATNGKLYGMTWGGGSYGGGVIFSFEPATNVFTKLKDFSGTEGFRPFGSLIQAKDGKVYGMTQTGIFSFDLTTNISTGLKSFGGIYSIDGAYPYGSLVQASDGKLYGMTSFGGSNNKGVMFSFDPVTNTFVKLKDFNGPDGDNPYGSLVQATDGKLYGMTREGGSYNRGVIFSFEPATNVFTKLKDLNAASGAYPYGNLFQAKDGKLYGVTSLGGVRNRGVIFSFNPITKAYTKLKDFNDADGILPLGSLIQASDGRLHGVTNFGGSNDLGVIFSFNPVTLGYEKIKDLDMTDGGRLGYTSLVELSCTATTYYRDADGDGYGDPATPRQECSSAPPEGYVSNNTDCDDTKAAIHPETLWYLDADGDGYFAGTGVKNCTSPGTGYRYMGLKGGGDCNDNNAAINPGATELCNGVDDNCNGVVDEGCSTGMSLTLVNATSNNDIRELKEGDVIDLSTLPDVKLDIRANAGLAKVGSVIFDLRGAKVHTQTENLLPYALFGDDMKGSYYGAFLPVGEYTLIATPYSEAKGSGLKGASLTIHFSVIYPATVSGFTLVNADSDKDLMTLKDGDTIRMATLPSLRLNIRANASPGVVGSVVFDLRGAQARKHIENHRPYALFVNNKSDYFAWTPQPGSYTLTATPHSAAQGSGEKGTSRTIRFYVLYPEVQSFTLVNAETGKDLTTLHTGEVLDLSTLPATKLNIRANTNAGAVGSVVFELKGVQTHKQTESLLPYALFGDDMKGRYYHWTPHAGNYQLTATPFSGQKASGVKGPDQRISFSVVNGSLTYTTAAIKAKGLFFMDAESAGIHVSPNPFSSQSTIRFSLPTSGYATLGVYSQSGVEVERLYQGQMEGAKEYRITLERKALPAGVYVLRLITAKETRTTKVVLVR